MLVQTVSTQQLCCQISGQLAELICWGELMPDERLASECDLSKHSGVSQASLREVLNAHEIDGHIGVHVGFDEFADSAPAANSPTAVHA